MGEKYDELLKEILELKSLMIINVKEVLTIDEAVIYIGLKKIRFIKNVQKKKYLTTNQVVIKHSLKKPN